jgi:hypothetical protein
MFLFQLTHCRKLALRVGSIAQDLIDVSQTKVRIRFVGVQFHRLAKSGQRVLILFLVDKNAADVHEGQTNVVLERYRLLQQGQSFLIVSALQGDVPEIGNGHRIVGFENQFRFKSSGGLVIFFCLPIKMAEHEIQIGLFRSEFQGCLHFFDGLEGFPLAIQRLGS